MNATAFHNVPVMFHDDDPCLILSVLDDLESSSQSPTKLLPETAVVPANQTATLDLSPPENTRQVVPSCAPFFLYKDFSAHPDPNPGVPVTAPGRIPNFPAKMFAILSCPELADIVSWMPHGRSWKVHKPREFEVKVIPMYFEHSKFSSFIRQANGWGFRRMITKGPDRNSYYHEQFLRGLPHLLKNMKRPTANNKPAADASTEPDLYRISEISPLPESKRVFDCNYDATDTSQSLQSYPLTSFSPLSPAQKPSMIPNISSMGLDDSAFEPIDVFARTSNVPTTSSLPLLVDQMVTTGQQYIPDPAPVHQLVRVVSEPVVTKGSSFFDNCFAHGEESQEFDDLFAGGLKPYDFFSIAY